MLVKALLQPSFNIFSSVHIYIEQIQRHSFHSYISSTYVPCTVCIYIFVSLMSHPPGNPHPPPLGSGYAALSKHTSLVCSITLACLWSSSQYITVLFFPPSSSVIITLLYFLYLPVIMHPHYMTKPLVTPNLIFCSL